MTIGVLHERGLSKRAMEACTGAVAPREDHRWTLQDLANLGELIGGLVVIVSLAYLAVQVGQNTQSLRTENHARALDRLASMKSKLSTDLRVSSMLAKGAAEPARLNPLERIQLTWWAYEAFGAFEFMFHQAQAHAIPDAVWRPRTPPRWGVGTSSSGGAAHSRRAERRRLPPEIDRTAVVSKELGATVGGDPLGPSPEISPRRTGPRAS